MAINTNKRVAVKHIRDRAKSAYDKKDICFICGYTDDLELHHLNSLTLLLDKWAKENGHSLATDEEVIAIRDEFIEAHHSEIYVEVFTLCNKHHVKLHSVFGKAPALTSAPKQSRWIEKQVTKANGLEPEKKAGSFSSFY
jgi:5-methylcytosine-specific restriction endonuclease McrA